MDKLLRDLAFSIVQSKKIDKKLIDSVLTKLTTKDKEKFLLFLKLAQEKHTITITTADNSSDVSSAVSKKFPDMYINHVVDDTIGGGVIVKIADDVYDYSVRNYITTTIKNLSNTL